MNPLYARIAVAIAAIVMIVIRAPHGQRSRTIKVVTRRRTRSEAIVLGIACACFFVPLAWAATGWPAVADFALHPAAFWTGVVLTAVGLWLFHRSHVDLGRNWSITLEVRERHALVTAGAYRTIRHPMYAALLLFSAGQALFLPNWIAGPAYLVAMIVLLAARLGPEERLMLDAFGAEYEAYRLRTRRLIPWVW
jgi:protein-S-isoprenylcysteine O-methyltransferase Ste14